MTNVHANSTSHNSQAPRAQKDMRDRRRYGTSFVSTMATIVNGNKASPDPRRCCLRCSMSLSHEVFANSTLNPTQNLLKNRLKS